MNTNNKKFRKSTIVIPALALMVLTAGASATGAVAWFTATRQVTANASTFTAVSSTSALTITAEEGNGTKVVKVKKDDQSEEVATPNITLGEKGKENYLCDASYDAANKKLYRSKLSDDGDISGFEEAPSTYNTGKKTNDGKHAIYYAVNWKYKFHYETTNEKGSALFFDLTSAFDGTTAAVSSGFRIAFNNTANADIYRVWTNDDVVTYVDSSVSVSTTTVDSSVSTTINYASYSSPKIVKTSSPYDRITDSIATSAATTGKSEYLGTFTQGGTGNDIEILCTAWYEGSDAAVVNGNLNTGTESLSANMKFYVRDLA